MSSQAETPTFGEMFTEVFDLLTGLGVLLLPLIILAVPCLILLLPLALLAIPPALLAIPFLLSRALRRRRPRLPRSAPAPRSVSAGVS
jgi:hypothetical protein